MFQRNPLCDLSKHGETAGMAKLHVYGYILNVNRYKQKHSEHNVKAKWGGTQAAAVA